MEQFYEDPNIYETRKQIDKEYHRIIYKMNHILTNPKEFRLRDHQLNCSFEITHHFKTENRGLIKAFCGAGKSFIIYNTVLEHGGNLSVIVVPSINLITQFNKSYFLNQYMKEYNTRNFKKKYHLLSICSKNELNKEYTDCKITTNRDVICNFLNDTISKIIIVTYRSLDLLVDIAKDININIDLICFDEAHHITADSIKQLLFDDVNYCSDYESVFSGEYETNNFLDAHVNKALFFTATPKNHNGINMHNTIFKDNNGNEYNLDDNDSIYSDQLHCGKLIFEYTHRDGVNDNILNDFNVRVDMYSKNTNEHLFMAISRSILETKNSRVLTFHSRSETKNDNGSNVIQFANDDNYKLFIKCFNYIVETEFPDMYSYYKNIYFQGITANTKNIQEILDNFDNTQDDEIFILSSCKTIGEGVDTKNANMVIFVDPKQSYFEIIQNIGRICRKNERIKQFATVMIPCYVDFNKYINANTPEKRNQVIRENMTRDGDFNGILNVLCALKQEDKDMFEDCLNSPNVYTRRELIDNFKRQGFKINCKKMNIQEVCDKFSTQYDDNKTDNENLNNLSKTNKKNIVITNAKITEGDVVIDNKYDDILCFLKTNNNYELIDENKKGKIARPNRNIKPKVHFDSDIKILWNVDSDIDIDRNIFGAFIKANVRYDIEGWYEKLLSVKEFIEKYNRRPSQHGKELTEKKLGVWVNCQVVLAKTKKCIMKNKNILHDWEKFVKENNCLISKKKKWHQELNKIKEYFGVHYKLPNRRNKDLKTRKMANWISEQQKNIKNGKGFVYTDEKIRKCWNEFVDKSQELDIKKSLHKSVNIKSDANKNNKLNNIHAKKKSKYQELTKKMSLQNSNTTSKMFKNDNNLWHQYHDSRDESFKGYKEQDEIPVNKIIKYIESIKNQKLTILDLGCGRNLIAKHFEQNKNLTIRGYDYVSYNGSIVCDISNLINEENNSVNICVFSQSLMGSNWKEYINEAKRVLAYGGRMIIAESKERYQIVKKYLQEQELNIIKEEYNDNKRWFYIYGTPP